MQNILMQFVVNIHIKLVDKCVAEQIAVAIAVVFSLKNKMPNGGGYNACCAVSCVKLFPVFP